MNTCIHIYIYIYVYVYKYVYREGSSYLFDLPVYSSGPEDHIKARILHSWFHKTRLKRDSRSHDFVGSLPLYTIQHALYTIYCTPYTLYHILYTRYHNSICHILCHIPLRVVFWAPARPCLRQARHIGRRREFA